ncbi:MAG: ECF transporter S component [Ardenticatenaceae bacterium]|nr:ECF transporter S component [Ardenticatenaceae bacterium]
MEQKKQSFFRGFTTSEIVIMAVIGVVFGIGGTPMVFVGRFFMTALGELGWMGFAAILGWFYLAGVLGGYIVRKPGASTLTEVISGVAQILSGNPNGVIVLLTTFLQGLGSDIAYALFGYRKFNTGVVALAGALAAPLGVWVDAYFFGVLNQGLLFNVIAVLIRIVSGAVFAIIGMWIFNAVAKAGVLRGTALDKEVRARVA